LIIYKYVVPIADNFIIQMPLGAEILTFQSQYDVPTLWAAVWKNSSIEDRKFSIIGTGHEIDMDMVKKFIGTIQMMKGNLVWHLFEIKS
jgi:hypothetical protein